MSSVSLAPRGRTFVRGLIANTLAKSSPAAFAAKRWGASHADRIAKAAVPALTSSDVGEPEAREFFSLAVSQSLIGRIQGMRLVPFNVRVTRQTTGALGHWVAEANPIPLSRQAVMGSTLPSLKVGAIVAATKESLTAMGDVVEAALQTDLLDAVSGALDAAFIDPTWAGTPDESPASITYWQTQLPASMNPKQDIETLVNNYTGSLRRAVLIMDPRTALQIGRLEGSWSDTKLGVSGGVLAGIPVLTTDYMPIDSNGGSITILDAAAIAYGARDFSMDTSDQADLIMADDPSSPGEVVNLWQTNTVAWKAVAQANWQLQGTGRVVSIVGTDYYQWNP